MKCIIYDNLLKQSALACPYLSLVQSYLSLPFIIILKSSLSSRSCRFYFYFHMSLSLIGRFQNCCIINKEFQICIDMVIFKSSCPLEMPSSFILRCWDFKILVMLEIKMFCSSLKCGVGVISWVTINSFYLCNLKSLMCSDFKVVLLY